MGVRGRLGGVTPGRRDSLCGKTEEGPWEPPTPGQSCAGGVCGGMRVSDTRRWDKVIGRSGDYSQTTPAPLPEKKRRKDQDFCRTLFGLMSRVPQIARHLCLKRVSRRWGQFLRRRELPAHPPKLGSQVQHLGQPHHSFLASSPAIPSPCSGAWRAFPLTLSGILAGIRRVGER